MRRLIYILLGVITMTMAACSSDDEPANNDLPTQIATFVSEYYPNQAVESYQAVNDGYQVIIKFGPTILFNKQYAWTSVDGNGSTLPGQMIYDQLPSTLYSYIEQVGALNQVFAISRDTKQYTVNLLNGGLLYTIATGQVSQLPVTAK